MVRRRKNATLVVLGDIGRSPRMCYHAKSLADRNYRVEIVGYFETDIHKHIKEHMNISIVPLRSPPSFINNLRPSFALLIKLIWTSILLFIALFARIHWPLLILMQNPPGVPSMLICWMCARIKQALFIIDWHNYTYSILREKYGIEELRVHRVDDSTTAVHRGSDGLSSESRSGEGRTKRISRGERAAQPVAVHQKRRNVERRKKVSLLQRIVERVFYWEGYFGRRADLNICVTHAMRQDLRDAWDVHSATLYDRPPSWNFRKLTVEEKHAFFWRICQKYDFLKTFAAGMSTHNEDDIQQRTRFSYRDVDGNAHLRDDRPFILVSSTSWTEDEDFGILLDALREYDSVAKLSSKSNPLTKLPTILCVITGKGPLKAYYLSRIEHLHIENVEIITPWLEAEDYPLILGCANIGVSLHTSTSGLDLPMKIVDMFGSGLPVIAKRFDCIGELVSEGYNGRLFDNFYDLCQDIKSLACGFPQHCRQLDSLRTNLEADGFISWDKNWDACVWPLLANYGAPPVDELARRKRFSVLSVEPSSPDMGVMQDNLKSVYSGCSETCLATNGEDDCN